MPLYSVAGFNVYLPVVIFVVALRALLAPVNYLEARPYRIAVMAMTLLFAMV